MGRETPRSVDLFYKGDADDGVRKLAELLGWESELDQMITEGRVAIEKRWKKMEAAAAAQDEAESAEEHAEGLAGASEAGEDKAPKINAERTAGETKEGLATDQGVLVPEAKKKIADADAEVDALRKAVDQSLNIRSKV